MFLLYLPSWRESDFPGELRRGWKGYTFDTLNELTDEDLIGGLTIG
ncbi:DUF6429 family protein [Allobacillus halotolerans]